MAKTRRVVRKSPPPSGPFFDEQLWPVIIALVVLGGFLIGVSLAYQPLEGAPWHRTAWPSLIGVPIVVLLAIVALCRIQSHSFRRSLQLSLVLCAILHAVLIVQMIETRIFAGLFPVKVEREKKEIIERRPAKIVPEYHPTLLVPEEDRPRQDFEKPVETHSPEPSPEPEKIVRQPAEEDRSPQIPQPVPLVEQQRTTEPNIVSRQRPNETAPRLAEQSSRLSRQVNPSEAKASRSAEMPQTPQSQPVEIQTHPAATSIARQAAQSAKAARAAAEPATSTSSSAATPQRQAAETSPQIAAATERPKRSELASEKAASETRVAAPSPAAKSAAPQVVVEPSATKAKRTATASAKSDRAKSEPLRIANRGPATAAERSTTSRADQPTVAAAASRSQKRLPQAAPPQATASTAVPAEDRNLAATNRTAAEATPQAIVPQRAKSTVAASRAPTPAMDALEPSSQPRSSAALSRAGVQPSPVTTLQPEASATGTPQRAVNSAARAASPTAAEMPAAAVAQSTDASAAPSRLALSRAEGGIVGAGRSANVENSMPGGSSPALVASGAARRAEATQREALGEALAPSAASQLARARAEVSIATAPLRAAPLEIAGAAAATQISEVTASSSASLTRVQAVAKNDAITAAKGTGEIDLGPTQRVTEAGIGRAASGGGQAELALQTPSPQLTRQRTPGGAPQMSLAGAVVGEVAAPAGDAGGAPPSSQPEAAQLAFARGGATDTGPLAARTAESAPAASEQSPAKASAATLSRADASAAPDAGAVAADEEEERRRLARKMSDGAGPKVNAAAESVSLPAATAGSDRPESQLAASQVGAARQSTDRGDADASAAPIPAGEIAARTTGSTAANELARSAAAAQPREQPQVVADGASASPARRAVAAANDAASTSIEAIPEVGPGSAVAQADIDHLLTGAGHAPMARRSEDALRVEVPAMAGPGGIGVDYTPEVGINARQARADSLNVQLRSARFLRTRVGGVPAVSTSAIVSSEAFSSRGARVRGDQPAGGRGTPAPQTEEAIERGLAFLARYQLPDGGWSLQGFPEGAQLASDTAATALAVIAFQGAGYHHREFQYKDVVQGGIDALVKGQKDNGDLFVPLDDSSNRSVWLYSHSLAAIALCEAYGMTQDPALRGPAQKAVQFIIAAQQPERGGWRYSPGVGADTSVSGWMMMALKSGELAGLEVPRQTYAKIHRWLDDAQQSPSEPHLYRYNPYAPDTTEQRHGRLASKTMTAVGLLMRLYAGWQRDNANMLRGAAYLGENLPTNGNERQPERDTYYWYYATQVMAHMGGEHWQAWIARLHPLLVDSQVREGVLAGSWDPAAPIPDRWGPQAGRLYVTTMNLLSLEVQYRKLPLYDEAIK